MVRLRDLFLICQPKGQLRVALVRVYIKTGEVNPYGKEMLD